MRCAVHRVWHLGGDQEQMTTLYYAIRFIGGSLVLLGGTSCLSSYFMIFLLAIDPPRHTPMARLAARMRAVLWTTAFLGAGLALGGCEVLRRWPPHAS